MSSEPTQPAPQWWQQPQGPKKDEGPQQDEGPQRDSGQRRHHHVRSIGGIEQPLPVTLRPTTGIDDGDKENRAGSDAENETSILADANPLCLSAKNAGVSKTPGPTTFVSVFDANDHDDRFVPLSSAVKTSKNFSS